MNLSIIVGHSNSDFDVVASMVAAKKLYPHAQLVFAGSQEKSVRNYLAAYPQLVPAVKAKQINLAEVTEMILVDTRYASRIGIFAELLNRPNVKITVFDHHPKSQGDITGDVEVIQEVGATTTILIELIKKQNLTLTPEEATLMALGIYEDTGSLTFLSTTKADLDAVKYLLDCGADLTLVPTYVFHDLDTEQIPMLGDLIRALTEHYIDGVKIAISIIRAEKYIGDLAYLVHKLRDIENLPVIFALVQLPDRVQVIARSQTKALNVAEVLSHFGGGGHRTAASALVKDITAEQLQQQLIETIQGCIVPLIRAKDMMSSPVMTVSPNHTVDQVRKIILRYGHSSFPVMAGNNVVGIVSRFDIDRAMHLGLAQSPINKFMSTNVISVDPLASLHQVRALLLEHDINLLPVIDSNRLIGVITRHDLLKITHQEFITAEPQSDSRTTLPLPESATAKFQNIAALMRERLPAELIGFLRQIGEVADQIGYTAFVVGGFVRDLLLNVPNYDIDIVVEGDGITFARKFARIINGHCKSHKRFNTAIVTLANPLRGEGMLAPVQKIDIATARTEFYEYPAALPQVEASTIKHDLYRRDFTINAMAIKLNPTEFGLLYDYFNGQRDLKKRTVRVLHNLSFVEDPTRIFRAIRFEQRYNFRIDKHTRHCLENALELELFAQLGNQRVREELVQILSEPNPIKAIRRMQELNILQFIHPQIRLNQALTQLFNSVQETLTWYRENFERIELRTQPSDWENQKQEATGEKREEKHSALCTLHSAIESWLLYFLALLDQLDLDTALTVCNRLVMPMYATTVVKQVKVETNTVLDNLAEPEINKPSRIYLVLYEKKLESVLFWLAKTVSPASKQYIQGHAQASEPVAEKIKRFLAEYRFVQIFTTGNDLLNLGYPPGPEYKKILLSLLLAKLDGIVLTKEDELKYLSKVFPL
ncbi:MAG: CBS domain-containing protein [bacterium]|nr:CBS domain-containing protein [bacterium]